MGFWEIINFLTKSENSRGNVFFDYFCVICSFMAMAILLLGITIMKYEYDALTHFEFFVIASLSFGLTMFVAWTILHKDFSIIGRIAVLLIATELFLIQDKFNSHLGAIGISIFVIISMIHNFPKTDKKKKMGGKRK